MYCQRDINSLALGKFEWNFRYVIFKRILVIDGWGISCDIALIYMSLEFTDDQSVVQVMAWCRQAKSHDLNQCWPRSLSPYGVTRAQWFKYDTAIHKAYIIFPLGVLSTYWKALQPCYKISPHEQWHFHISPLDVAALLIMLFNQINFCFEYPIF